MHDICFEKLSKTVKVTDPECWYNRDTVEVSLFVTPTYDGKRIVRIFIDSIDDFAVSYDWECYAIYTDAIKSMYDHIKYWLYDKMPDTISLDWLYEHGYLPY